MREFIGDHISIDGRMIGYRIFNVREYLSAKGMDEEEIEGFSENNCEVATLINQIIAVKQSCWLLRRTSNSCGSLSNDMYGLKNTLIRELREKYEYEFDEELMEEYCEE